MMKTSGLHYSLMEIKSLAFGDLVGEICVLFSIGLQAKFNIYEKI